jgi:hypothetical protein
VKIAVVSDDANFVAAVTGLAGAMGHEAVAGAGEASLTVLDGALDTAAFAAALGLADSLATVVFAPGSDGAAAGMANSAGVMHVYPRRSLPVELPRLIAPHSAE